MEALRFEGYSFAYPGNSAVLHGIDWEVPEGSFELLVGTTGSGKTTLLRSAKPELSYAGTQTGSVRVFGVSPDASGKNGYPHSIGYVSQSPANQITCDSVWHELAFGLENQGVAVCDMRRRVAEVAAFFGIEPWIDHRTADLSGGQRQIVALASALALQPDLLLLDEPTAQLDPVSEKNFLHALFRINREIGITVVVATHAPEAMVPYATGCVRLERGVLAHIDMDELVPDDGSCTYRTRNRASGATSKVTRPAQEYKPARERALEIRDAWFRYDRNSPWVLRDASIDVERGSIHAVVGGNGSGKSTLLALAAGTLRSERGKVRNRLQTSQAFLPQDPRLLFVCDTVSEELDEWRNRCGFGSDDVQAMLERIGMADAVGRHPYDLSGGEQQKLALAKVLLADPDLLVLDEPTKGLDTEAKLDVARILCDLRSTGKTVVLATHDLSFATAISDAVSMLFAAEVTCTDSPEGFFAGSLFYRPSCNAFARRWCTSDPSDGTGFCTEGGGGL